MYLLAPPPRTYDTGTPNNTCTSSHTGSMHENARINTKQFIYLYCTSTSPSLPMKMFLSPPPRLRYSVAPATSHSLYLPCTRYVLFASSTISELPANHQIPHQSPPTTEIYIKVQITSSSLCIPYDSTIYFAPFPGKEERRKERKERKKKK